ncbi:LPXTG-motif cell wall anchor domain-containing protein [Micromonospora viridifaciens]|uniref:LPXTG-motif cell wall anchor domain-containing protein n=1 Tax=Micromonospora viridifaciens TaxID=1881 RepID=A0A1C4ZAN2_MICVI|nr:LPXTG cell wall anchor domain-containing protein [Micromonospora viridifaciens]SCF30015.1 LPXTG-motif cell wall anchor domain-containing protein [Micromonospora viridifaciens]
MPQRRHVARAGFTVAAATTCLALATPAWASSTISLHSAHKGSTAAGFGEQKCSDERFADKAGNQDGWHFVLPGGKDSGSFESLSLTFKNGSTQVEVKIPDSSDAYPDFFYSAGGRTIHAYLFTPAGWTLADGSAVISGKGSKFNLSHTCPGKAAEESPSPSPSTPGEESPTPTPSTPGEETPTPTPSTPGEETPTPTPSTPCEMSPTPTPGEESPTPGEESPTPCESGGPSETPSPSSSVGGGAGGDSDNGGGLPVTGVAVTGIALTGLVLVGGGAALMVLRRRRDKITFTS